MFWLRLKEFIQIVDIIVGGYIECLHFSLNRIRSSFFAVKIFEIEPWPTPQKAQKGSNIMIALSSLICLFI